MKLSAKISLLGDLAAETLRRSPRGGGGGTLVVRTDRIGDLALYLPFAASLRRALPRGDPRLTLLGRELWLPLAEALLDFDRYIAIDPGRFLADAPYRRGLKSTLRAGNWDTLLQPRHYRELLVEDQLALAAHPRRAAGFAATRRHLQYNLLKRFDRLYSPLVSGGKDDRHELLRNLDFFRATMPEAKIVNPFRPCPLPAPPPWRSGQYAVILPGSGKGDLCRWPAERFAALAGAITLPCAVAGSAARNAELTHGR